MESVQIIACDHDESKISVEAHHLTVDQILDKINKSNLDSDVCKKITTIADNSAGTFISLSGVAGDSEATLIGEALSTNDTLKTLDLKRNNITDVGAAAIGEGLSKNSTLQILHLSKNDISDVGAAAIGEGLSKNTGLQHLALMGNNISDVGAAAIGEGLSKNSVLQKLYLSHNNIGDIGVSALAEGLSRNTTLQQLSLTENQMTHVGSLALAKAFRWHENLLELDADPDGTEYAMPETIAEIGRGAFGSVSLAQMNDVEVVEKKSHGQSNREEIYERLILQGLPEHKNVVRLAALSMYKTLLLDAHKGGSLKDFVRKQRGGVPLEQFLSYSHGMSLAIEHLHNNGLIHRDVALRNYVLTEDLQTPVLVDFGLSWPIDEEKSVKIRPSELMPFRQCAPEVLTTLHYSKASDIWQLGLAFWQFLHSGRQPFFQFANGQQLVQYFNKKMVQSEQHIPLSFKKNGAVPALIDAIEEVVVFCCSYDPTERPTAAQLVKKIQSMRESGGVQAEEEKEVCTYEPDEGNVESGLREYNYTDYDKLTTGGRSDYVDLNGEVEEYGSEEFEEFPEVDVDVEGSDGYQEFEVLPE